MSDQTDALTPEGEETSVEQERPEWLPETFDKPEDLAKSYQELQRKLGEQGSELARLRPLEEQIGELTELVQAQQAPQAQFDPMQHPLVAGAQRAMDEGDAVGFLAAAQQLLAAQQAPQAPSGPAGTPLTDYTYDQAAAQVASRYGADEAMVAKATEIMQTDPFIAPQVQELVQKAQAGQATVEEMLPFLDLSHRLASQGVANAQAQSLAQQQQQQELARSRKLEQESLTGAGPTRVASPDERQAAWERIKGADLGNMPRVIPG